MPRRHCLTIFLIPLSSFLISCPFAAPEKKSALSKGATVNLSIGFDEGSHGSQSSRALTDLMALVAVQRFEVVFYYNGPNGDGAGAETYRAAWARGERGQLWVQAADYGLANTNGNSVILFAGFSNHTLLAIGQLIAVNGKLGAVIDEFSISATFSLVPLNNDIFGEEYEELAFQIGNPLITPDTETLYGYDYPVFVLPPNATIPAAYAIDFDGIPPELIQGVVTAGPPRVIAGFMEDEPLGLSVRGAITNIPYTGAAISAIPPDGVYELELTTNAIPGLLRLSIDIPVYALNTVNDPITWRIQGGILNTALDRGRTSESTGGAILVRAIGSTDEDPPGYSLIVFDNGLPRHFASSSFINEGYPAHAQQYTLPGTTTPSYTIINFNHSGQDRFNNPKTLMRMAHDGISTGQINVGFEIKTQSPINLLEERVLALSLWIKSNVAHTDLYQFMGFGDNDVCTGSGCNLSCVTPNVKQSFLHHSSAERRIHANQWTRFIIPVPPMKEAVTITRVFFAVFHVANGQELLFDDIRFVTEGVERAFGDIPVSRTIPNADFNPVTLAGWQFNNNIIGHNNRQIPLIYTTTEGVGPAIRNCSVCGQDHQPMSVTNGIQTSGPWSSGTLSANAEPQRVIENIFLSYNNWFNFNPTSWNDLSSIIRIEGDVIHVGNGIYRPTGTTFQLWYEVEDAIDHPVRSNRMTVTVEGP
ncbi:MAG: hypothetical protein FWD36_04100 [Treponema sp.]|nr:hypothetical protein [Treponema sp.]